MMSSLQSRICDDGPALTTGDLGGCQALRSPFAINVMSSTYLKGAYLCLETHLILFNS